MQWLNAALAFSITMLVLSMMVSTLVETFHRLLNTRVKGLEIMLGELYDDALAPHVAACAALAGQSVAAWRAQFVAEMTVSRGSPEAHAAIRRWRWETLSRIDVNEFMSRLGGSAVGDAVRSTLGRAGAETGELVLHELAVRFESFGREASDYFQRRARLLSVLMAFVLAWCANVNPYELFKTYASDARVSNAVIALQDEATRRYEAATAQVVAPAADADAAALDQARAKLSAIKGEIGDLQARGAPLGWTPERLASAGFSNQHWLSLPLPTAWNGATLVTVFWLLLGGLLIGLGGPFWYDIVRSVSGIRGVLGGDKPPARTDGDASPQPPTAPAVNLFKIAAAGRDAAQAAGEFRVGPGEPPVVG